jgi:hypothetical protein
MWIKTEELWETTTTRGCRNLVAMAAALVMTTTRITRDTLRGLMEATIMILKGRIKTAELTNVRLASSPAGLLLGLATVLAAAAFKTAKNFTTTV